MAYNGTRIHTTRVIIAMNTQPSNTLSRLERDYVSFLYDNARRTTNQTVTIDQIKQFVTTPEGQRGLEVFKAMSKKPSLDSKPQRVGAFL